MKGIHFCSHIESILLKSCQSEKLNVKKLLNIQVLQRHLFINVHDGLTGKKFFTSLNKLHIKQHEFKFCFILCNSHLSLNWA